MKKQHQPLLPRGYDLTNEIAKSAAHSTNYQWTRPKSRPIDPNKGRRKSMKNITLAKKPPAG